jgi:hypothetical protein
MPIQALSGATRGLHVDQLLTQILKDRGVTRRLSYPKLFPGVPVSKISDLVGRIDTANQLQLYDGIVGDDGIAEQVSFNVTSPLRYYLIELAFEAVIRNIATMASDQIFDYAARQAQYPYDRMRLRLEYACVNQTCRVAANFPSTNETLAAAKKWSNYGSLDSNPIRDLLTWCRIVRENSGRPISGIYMSQPVWDTMALHPAVLGRMDVTTTRVMTKKMLAEILRVDESVIMIAEEDGLYNAGKRGQALSLKYFWGSDVFVAAAAEPSREDNSFGHMYYLGNPGDEVISAYRYPRFNTPRGAEVVQVSSLVHPLIENDGAAFLGKAVVEPSLSIYNGRLD